MNRLALFLGCTIPARTRNYEMSAREVACILGIELVDIPGFSCCGFPAQNSHLPFSWALSLRNLALADEQNLDICTLCSACTAMLAETALKWVEKDPCLDTAIQAVEQSGHHLQREVSVRHFSRILLQDIGYQTIRNSIRADLSGLRILAHYGCHYLKPSEIHHGIESVENPSSLDTLIEWTGARAIKPDGNKHCCGGSVMAFDRRTTYLMAAEKLELAKSLRADAICVVCPFCGVVYDDNQKNIEAAVQTDYGMPIIYYPQLLGLAMGIEPKKLGFSLNKIKPSSWLTRFQKDES